MSQVIGEKMMECQPRLQRRPRVVDLRLSNVGLVMQTVTRSKAMKRCSSMPRSKGSPLFLVLLPDSDVIVSSDNCDEYGCERGVAPAFALARALGAKVGRGATTPS
jgi:hypothetical protein